MVYSKKCDTFSQLLQHADNKLFASLNKPTHCSHYLLPPIKPYVRTLRSRSHNYTLPKCKYSQYKNSFVCRHMYSKANTKTQIN